MKVKQKVPYILQIVTNGWIGNFDRELVGYSMGLLDEVQMEIDFADEEREAFWKEVYNENEARTEFSGSKDYNLLDEFLLETYQDVDDWEQMTFYNCGRVFNIKDNQLYDLDSPFNSYLNIQLVKPLSKEWEDIIIPRIKEFFEKNIFYFSGKDIKLLKLVLFDEEENVVKNYLDN